MSDNENNTIFRKEVTDRIDSPEQLNQYIHVTRPSVWLLFGAIIVLMGGLLFWVFKGEMESYVDMLATAENGHVYAYVDPFDVGRVSEGNKTVLDRQYETVVVSISESRVRVPEELTEDFKEITGPGERAFVVTLENTGIPDGVYKAEVMVEKMRPLDYFLGGE